MLKLERSPSHSWWWDSHNSPKHSKWLQSNLQDLDEKVKEMLRLIEEDADSFAQRAEMYYQKRPELVNLVEEFYRAYRSLAERYDHLTGEIRQNIPRALQVQYGLSCDSPKTMSANGGRHHYSPLRRSNPMFENLLKKASDQAKESDQTVDFTQSLHGKFADDISMANGDDRNGHDVPCVDSQHNSSYGGVSSTSSDSEVDNLTPLNRLRQEIDELKESNRVLTDSHQNALLLNTSLHNKMKELEEGYRRKNDEADALRSKVDVLNVDLLRFKAVSKEEHSVVLVNDVQEKEPQVEILPYLEEHSVVLANDVQEKEPQVEILPYLEEEIDSCAGDEDTCESAELFKGANMAECKHEGRCNEYNSMRERRIALLDCLQGQIAQLKEEILERGEEKREAIRQLSFSMDVLKSKNQRLEVMLSLLKKRLNASNVRTAHHSPLPAWKQLFSMVGDWRGLKRGQPFAAVAL